MHTSIILPNLDCPLIGRALAALAGQGAPGGGVEVLVVGRDTPGLVPRDGAGRGLRFLETAERLNPAAARNRAVAEARGDRLLFLDADCRPLPGWLESLLRALDTAAIAGGAVTFPTDPAETSVWALADNIASFHELLADRPAEPATTRPLGSLNLAVRREAWEKVGPFDETLPTSEDHDWILRARALGIATAFEPRAVVEHAAVRADRAALEAHAAWYGRHFHRFRTRHPEAFAQGPTWQSPALLAATAPVKAWTGAAKIFLEHPALRPFWRRTLPAVAAFRRAWYRAVLEGWREP